MTNDDLQSRIRDCKAELDRRARDGDIYTHLRIGDENHQTFNDVYVAIVTNGCAVRNVSNPDHPDYVSGNAKNWVANAGGLAKFKATTRAWFEQGVIPTSATISTDVVTTDVPEMVSKYLRERKDAGNGFTTELILVETGSHEGNPFGIFVKPNGIRYVVGDLLEKDNNVRAFRDTTSVYRNVEKATKGQRAKCDIVVFDPVG